MVRYLVLHLLARLLHIRLEGNGQDENEEERRKMEMKSKKKKKARVEENEVRVEDTVGVASEGWKRGWEQDEEKSLENWSALNGLELGVRLSRLENLRLRFKTYEQAGLKGGGKPGGSREAPGGGGGKGETEDGVATCCSCHRQVQNLFISTLFKYL